MENLLQAVPFVRTTPPVEGPATPQSPVTATEPPKCDYDVGLSLLDDGDLAELGILPESGVSVAAGTVGGTDDLMKWMEDALLEANNSDVVDGECGVILPGGSSSDSPADQAEDDDEIKRLFDGLPDFDEFISGEDKASPGGDEDSEEGEELWWENLPEAHGDDMLLRGDRSLVPTPSGKDKWTEKLCFEMGRHISA